MANGEHIIKHISGVYAALITPFDAVGRPDTPALHRLIDFALGGGVDGLCFGGATAEYPHLRLEDRKRIIESASKYVGERAPFVVAIGAPTARDVVALGVHALDAGARALLVPMPYFYRYSQADLQAYVRHVARELDAPILLYNLPAFANKLELSTMLELLRTVDGVVGIKNSSGNPAELVPLAESHSGATLICGADDVVLEALDAGWDGVISGVASCCPEVLVVLYRYYRAGRVGEATRCRDLLGELLATIGRLPFPWSIRVAAEVRGISNGELPFPLSRERRNVVEDLRRFYADWFARHLPTLRREVREVATAN